VKACPLSLRERVAVRDLGYPVRAGVSLFLASSLREEAQGKKTFVELKESPV
jgi:hypothetical protein